MINLSRDVCACKFAYICVWPKTLTGLVGLAVGKANRVWMWKALRQCHEGLSHPQHDVMKETHALQFDQLFNDAFPVLFKPIS